MVGLGWGWWDAITQGYGAWSGLVSVMVNAGSLGGTGLSTAEAPVNNPGVSSSLVAGGVSGLIRSSLSGRKG